ncbi:MAG: serine hydrolase domain-containing protein [Myxococcota bacterium]
MTRSAWLALALVACGTTPAPAAPTPAARGLDAAGLAALKGELDAQVEAGVCPGYLYVVARDGELQATERGGTARVGADEPFTPTTPVRIASMTKPVTAALALTLVDAGTMRLDQAAADFVPELANLRVATEPNAGQDGEIPTEALARPLTVRDLLTHTSGLSYFFGPPSDLVAMNAALGFEGRPTLEEAVRAIAGVPLGLQPGARWAYSWSSDVLGRVVEVAAGEPLEDYAERTIFAPLGMGATGFPLGTAPESLPPLYIHDEGGALVEETNDMLVDTAFASGGGGLVSTAADYLRFAQMLANDGELEGTRVLSEASARALRSDQLTDAQRPARGEDWFFDAGYGYGVGVAIAAFPETNAERGAAPGDFGWAGAYDTTFLVSPSRGVVGVFVAQVSIGAHTPGRCEGTFARNLHRVAPE